MTLAIQKEGETATYSKLLDINIVTICRISPDGNDENDGTSWGNAMKTVAAAVNRYSENCHFWIEKGHYETSETFIGNTLSLLGGFTGNEDNDSQRNLEYQKTILVQHTI